MELVLIRHSKTKRDPRVPIALWGLSEKGIEAANKLSSDRKIQKLDILYTSLQTKALETAVILAKPNALPIKTNDGLTESTSYTNKFIPDPAIYELTLKDYYAGKIQRINGGETLQEALDRFNSAIESIVKENKDKKRIGIVSHGHILTLFSSQFKDIDLYDTHLQIKQPDIAIFDWDRKVFNNFFGTLS